MPLGSSAIRSLAIGSVAKHKYGLESFQVVEPNPPELRLLSEAPIVTTFLAVPGAMSESGSITPSPPLQNQSPGRISTSVPSLPELPAAKKMAISGWSHMN